MPARLTVLFLVAFSAFLGVLGRNVGKEYSLVLVGGGLYDNNTAIWERIIELGGGKGAARFGVISAASEVNMLVVCGFPVAPLITRGSLCLQLGSLLRCGLKLGVLS